jgi:hypothetical protein
MTVAVGRGDDGQEADQMTDGTDPLKAQSTPADAAASSPESFENPLRRIHRKWKAYCESLGYDVDGNRKAIADAIEAAVSRKG